jgi:hypothetical protein
VWKNRAAWAVILLAAAGLYFFENNVGTRILLLLAVLLPVCSAFLLLFSRAGLQIALDGPETLGLCETGATC